MRVIRTIGDLAELAAKQGGNTEVVIRRSQTSGGGSARLEIQGSGAPPRVSFHYPADKIHTDPLDIQA